MGEGLTLALLLPRVYYAGDQLLAFIDRARAASEGVEASRLAEPLPVHRPGRGAPRGPGG